jgi:hypothetical protein
MECNINESTKHNSCYMLIEAIDDTAPLVDYLEESGYKVEEL